MEIDFLIHMTLLEFQKRGKFSWIRPIWSQAAVTSVNSLQFVQFVVLLLMFFLFFYPSHPTQPPREKFLLNLTLVFFWLHTGCIQTCNLLLSLFFNSFLLHPQAMTFSAHSANAFIPPKKTKKKRKENSTVWAVVSDPAVTDGSLISAWENNCGKENNPSFRKAPSSPCLFLIFPPSSPHYSHKSVT